MVYILVEEVVLNFKKSVKPISYIKTHASRIVQELAEIGGSYIITQNGKAKAVLQDLQSWEETRESLALLKILALSTKNLEANDFRSLDDAFSSLESRLSSKK